MGRKPRNNNNKNNQPHIQASASTHQTNNPIQTELPNKRKKRNQTVEQAVQVQQPRQSVFARIGTINSSTTPLPRQPVKKEVKDHPSGNETRKSRRISDARKAEREQLEGDLKQDSAQDAKYKPEGGTKRNIQISKAISNNTVKSGKREEPRLGKPLRRNSNKQLEQKQMIRKDDLQESETLSLNAKDIQKEEKDEDTRISHELSQVDASQSSVEYDPQNTEQVIGESKDVETQRTDETDQITSENLESIDPTELFVQQQNNAVYEHVSGLAQSDHESDMAKEDVVSIQADDDDYLMEDEDQDDPSLLSERLINQEFGDSHESSQLLGEDSYKDRERVREKDGRNKDTDNIKDIPLRMRSRATNSDDGRNSDRSYRETSQQSHVDDRRTRLYEIREREREERYNRAMATDRAHDDRNFERDRRERERQDRYNKSIMEDKAHMDVPRRNERDRFREFERNQNHGSRTPNAETSSNSTIRGATSRSPSDSDRDRKPPSRTRSPERGKDRDLRPRDDVPRDREWGDHRPLQDFQRDRDRIPRQREDLSNRDRDSRIRDLSKEKELTSRELKIQDREPVNLRRVDQLDVAFRRLDERVPNARRLDDPRNTGIPDRNSRDPPPREKDNHYHRDQALRPEPIRRDERQPVVRSKNETQSDPIFQDNRDKEPRQRIVQSNVLTEHDHRPDKRKREDIDLNERKAYYDREQRGDANSFNQRLPDYRIRDKERDQRHREDYPPKDGNRTGINNEQDRDLTNRKEDRLPPTHDRNVGLPDLYRPSSEHHLKEPDRRPIREYERDYRDVGIDRYRTDYDREIRDRVREGHESRSNSVEKTDPHKLLYDRHQRESEKRVVRDLEDDAISRTNRSELARRVDAERSVPTINNQRDNNRDYPQEILVQEDKSKDPHDQFIKDSKKVPVNEEDDPSLPHPWIKCKSSRNKYYYFNTQTRESQWNYPGQNDGNKTTDYDSRRDEDEPRKKIRLNDSGDISVTNADLNIHEDKAPNTMVTTGDNDSIKKETSLKEETSFDQQSESSSRLPRNNSNSFLYSPPMPQAPSPGMPVIFSPPHRSISSEYNNERRFSADYGIQLSPRRGSYVGSQPHSPQMSSLRPNPFNRGGSADLYDRNDVFRNEEFISNRSLGDPRNITSPSGNNNGGMMTPTFPGSPIRSTRSGMYNSFGIDQNSPSGSRHDRMGRELPIFAQSSPMPRTRNVPEEEHHQFYSEQNIEVDEPSTNNGHNHERSEMDFGNQATSNQSYETYVVDERSEDEYTWRSDNEPVEYGAAETEPVSIFLFRRAGSRVESGVKKKFLNPRKEYEAMKTLCGGKGMHLFKHSFATAHRE